MATETARLTHSRLKFERTSLTFMHGIGLKMEGVGIEHPELAMQAGHININVRLLPLLLGKIEVETLNIHDASFRIRTVLPKQASLAELAALPVQRIRLIRARLEGSDGEQILQDLHLDLRNIGAEREALWEFQGTQGKLSLNGHGSLNFHHGAIDSGFGKLKFEHIPVTWLSPFAPGSLRKWFGNPANRIDGVLTLDLKGRQSWSVFGEAGGHSESGGRLFSLRGKLHHPDNDQYFWDDSFIHVGERGVIATKGQCFQLECEASVAAKGLPLHTLSALLPEGMKFPHRLAGESNIHGLLQWKKGVWSANGSLELKQATYQHLQRRLPLPDLQFDRVAIAGDAHSWRASSGLNVADSGGRITVTGSRRATGETNTELVVEEMDRFPQSLTDIVLATLNMEPGLQARGGFSGNMQLQRDADGNNSMQLQLNANQARIAYPARFEKPAGVAAQCRASVSWPESGIFSPASIRLQYCRLHTSRVGELSWRQQKRQQSLEARELDLNLDALREVSVLLPQGMRNLQGRLAGHLRSSWPLAENSTWLHRAEGTLELDGFGSTDWHGSGKLNMADGVFSSAQFHTGGRYGEAALRGHYNLPARQGMIDILAGKLNWGDLPPLPQGWKTVRLSGRLQQGQLSLLGNELHRMEGRYRLRQGTLNVEELHAQLAGGQIHSPSFSLSPNDAGLAVSGRLRAENIRLQELAGMHGRLQAELAGRLHLNLKLQGQLPAQNIADWQRSNGDILIYNGSWRPHQRADRNAAARTSRFNRLSFRLRLQRDLADISRLELQRGEKRYTGSAGIDADGHIRGVVRETTEGRGYALEGTWPVPDWRETP